MIGTWINPDRIEFDTLEACEKMAERLTYGKIITACEIDGESNGISEPINNLSRVL